MKHDEYIAHKTEDGRLQSVKDHLQGTAALCASFASRFGAKEAGRLCGLAHDIGKYSDGFQNRILNEGKKVDHALQEPSNAGAFVKPVPPCVSWGITAVSWMREGMNPKSRKRAELLKTCLEKGMSNDMILNLVAPMRGKTDEEKEILAEQILNRISKE